MLRFRQRVKNQPTTWSNMGIHGLISDLLDKLIADGQALLRAYRLESQTGWTSVEDEPKLRRWSNEILLFQSLTGKLTEPWADRVDTIFQEQMTLQLILLWQLLKQFDMRWMKVYSLSMRT